MLKKDYNDYIEIAKKYFTVIDVDSVTSLHEIPQVLEDIEISDIYIKNNYIDVRLYFDNEPIFVPESHFNYNIAPLAYMFIKVNEELSSATVTGFVLASSIDSSKAQNGYITISEEDLIKMLNYLSVNIRKAMSLYEKTF